MNKSPDTSFRVPANAVWDFIEAAGYFASLKTRSGLVLVYLVQAWAGVAIEPAS